MHITRKELINVKFSAAATAVLIAANVLFSGLSVTAHAEEDELVYVALGDSIAYGYGLDKRERDAYPYITAKAIGADKFYDFTLCGAYTSDILKMAEENANALAEADVISLTVGSNSLFVPFLISAADMAGVEFPETEASADKLEGAVDISVILGLYRAYSNEKSPQRKSMDEAFAQFRKEWIELIDLVYEINPHADIVVTGYYNPYRYWNIKPLNIHMGDIVQIYISKMNKFIEVSCRKKYRIADISKVMSDNIPDIKNPANNRFDPHPDSRWQAYIAKEVISEIRG